MNSIVAGLIGMTFVIVLAGGCSQPQTVRHTMRHTVILTPDPDGRVGKAEIITEGGKQILDTPHGMTTVSSRNSAPSPVTMASPELIRASFAEAMAIEPTPPEKFILYFNNGTTELVPKSRADIASILDAIKRRAAINISIFAPGCQAARSASAVKAKPSFANVGTAIPCPCTSEMLG